MEYAKARPGRWVRYGGSAWEYRDNKLMPGFIGIIDSKRHPFVYVTFNMPGDGFTTYGCYAEDLTPLTGRERTIAMAAVAFGVTPELEQ